jgi:ADP-ribose pyrophosphatase YjhB (NUDIX family)
VVLPTWVGITIEQLSFIQHCCPFIQGESIQDCVEREVWEETGIRAHFRGVITFYEKDNFRFGHSDFYFVCLMFIDDNDGEQTINFDPLEITACEWKPLDEWMNSLDPIKSADEYHLLRLAADVIDGRVPLLENNEIVLESSNSSQSKWRMMTYGATLSHEK